MSDVERSGNMTCNKRANFRQGDLALLSVDSIPEDVTEVIPVNGSIVLLEGEVTGHFHKIIDAESPSSIVGKVIKKAQLFSRSNGQRFLKVNEPCCLGHEEHFLRNSEFAKLTGETIIPKGLYEIPEQMDMHSGVFRKVVD